MINIRKNVFETNSSSSHSISISGSNKFEPIVPDHNGNIYISGGQFGWDEEEYDDFYNKANYCAVDKYTQNDADGIDMLRKVIMQYTGAKKVVFYFDPENSTSINDYNLPYIDHQSIGTSDEAFESEETLKQFLFDSNSYLMIDNDNH
jgi:hypothetical protein